MRKALIQIVLALSLVFVIVSLFRTNLSMRTQLSVINQAPSRSSFESLESETSAQKNNMSR
jgi:hypothetical protein